ncbi:TPA: hypothetical protein GFY10_24615 [Escherichia coli]|uniref:hypothetical protein n=1 Tax=Escherichia coli TaxID=562 RepID=UPI00130001C0|nr:hypothetical protein [Escherichia coli]MBS9185352.1 hypothetical protein [Escherichia coli]MWD35846.1 hypothetical protein [Escherichia coli]HAH3067972.1 hypothetical protein [Escherichia coli]HAH3077260.1 hypothetical protein [Escherichia coli]HBP4736016.1 hypothetical protein [Escherichia coli]
MMVDDEGTTEAKDENQAGTARIKQKKLNSNFITITAGFQHNNIHCQPTHDYYVFILAENMYTEIRSNSMSVSTFLSLL